MKEHDEKLVTIVWCWEIEGLKMDVKHLREIMEELILENHNLKKSLKECRF